MNGLIDDAVVMAWDAICDPYQRRYQILTNEIHLGPMVPSPSSLGLDLDVRDRRVLDFGCGAGQNAIACSLAGAAYVVGTDPSERQLDLARELAERAGATVDFRNLRHGGFAALPTDFDLVLSIYALQFVEDLPTALRELARHMAHGGLLVISVDHPMRLSGEWDGEAFVVENYFDAGWQRWPYDFPEAGLTVEMRRFRRPMEEWVGAILCAPLVLQRFHEPRPPPTADSFGRYSKYGTDDPRNVFSREHLERVPGTLVIVAQKGR